MDQRREKVVAKLLEEINFLLQTQFNTYTVLKYIITVFFFFDIKVSCRYAVIYSFIAILIDNIDILRFRYKLFFSNVTCNVQYSLLLFM